MAAITEDYVSFETAKLLKEKGFDENTEHEIWYVIKQFSTGCHWNSCTYKVGGTTREYDDDCCIPMPTIQMARKWLRRIHNVNIDIVPVWNQKRFEYQIFVVTPENAKHCYVDNKLYPGYEEAAEEAIKYCLKHLIK